MNASLCYGRPPPSTRLTNTTKTDRKLNLQTLINKYVKVVLKSCLSYIK